MKILGRDEILSAPDRKGEPVDVPEWGGSVLVAPMAAVDRDEIERRFLTGSSDGKLTDPEAFRGLRAYVAAACIVDEDGRRVFTSDDLVALGDRNAKALDRVFEVGWKLSGMVADATETAEKN